jgi:pimeloyl-ACP methyl ester carboxylesterase
MKTKDRHSSIAGAQGLAKESSADRALPVLKGADHRFLDLPGLRMHVAEAGSGRPLLLLHGFPQHWWEWRKVIPGLAEQFRLICPDLRGAGWTDAPRRGYTRDQLLADVVALLDTLGLDSVHLLTHDLGGLIGYQLCLRHSERVRRHLALSIPPPYFEFDPGLVLAIVQHAWFNLLVPVLLLGPRLLGGRRQRLPRWMLSGFSSAREAFTAEDVELFVGRFREPSRARAGSALYRHFIQPEVARTMTGTYRGRRLSTPTRVLLGADDPNVRPKFIRGVEDHVDVLHTEIVAGASHFIVDDVPGVVVAQALDFFTP